MANLISLLRVLLAFLAVWLLFVPTSMTYWWAFVLTVLVIWMDGLDGYVARKLNETSKAGAVIDILGDRVVELTYWISFAVLGWVPLWMPLVVMTRGIVVDGLRSLALEAGYTAFGSSTMMQHPIGVALVSSRASRWLYAVLKAVCFAVAILAHHPDFYDWVWLPGFAGLCLWLTVIFCVIRGLPVLLESKAFLSTRSQVDC